MMARKWMIEEMSVVGNVGAVELLKISLKEKMNK